MPIQTDAERFRGDLLLQLHDGAQPILDTFVHKHMFPDITLAEWCNDHEVKVELIVIGEPGDRQYTFYQFSLIEEDSY